jgi:hypothetical protein
MKKNAILLFLYITAIAFANAQQVVDKGKFFKDTSTVNAALTLNIRQVLNKSDKIGYIFPATFACKLSDSLNINDKISVEVRGHFRRGYCYLPPIKLIFKNNKNAAFYHLKSLKLVNTCKPSWQDDQNLLKEFLIYKIYNLVTDKSFRVRLLNLSYKDSSGKRKTITEHAFLIEDIREVAKRNNCDDWTGKKIAAAATNRQQMTLMAIFEYMIGNTDWAVMAGHNIKLIHTKSDSTSRPFAVPYDFDYSGFVNAYYAIPDERLGIESVRERLYRGLPRAPEELKQAFNIFNSQKANIYSLIDNFSLLTPGSKKEMKNYLDSFYKTINNPADVKEIFVDNLK